MYVDPDKYSYIKLLQDVGELSLSHVFVVIGFAINLHCDIPGSNDRMIVSSDLVVLKMFEIHNSREINIYVTTMSVVPCHIVDVSETVTVSSQSSEDEISISDSDDIYGLIYEDEAFVPSVGENLRKSTCNTAASPSVNVEIHGGDDFSDFDSNDDVEYNPSSDDSNIDEGEGEGEGKGKSTSRVFEYNLYGEEYHTREGDKIVLKSGQLFENVDKFREVLRDYTIQQGCSIIREKNEKAKVTAHYADSSCMWRIHASPLPDGVTYMIKTSKGEHTCMRLQSNSNANSSWIAKKLREAIKTNPDIKVDAMQTYLQKTYGIEASRMQLYKAKMRALDEIEGKHGSSYTMLPMIFIAFEALFKGFKVGCRPFIRIDGCHLKGPYDGVLLVAVSLDGNNGLFPIAVGVVESENRDSWGFFLQNLNTVIGAHSSEGLDRVIVETFLEATHRRCCRHLCANMRSKFLEMLVRKYFWRAARSYNEVDFRETVDHLREVSVDAHTWLMKVPVASWSRHAFDTRLKNDHATNNLTESFNNWVGSLRGKPILIMLEDVRSKIMYRIRKRFEKGCSWEGIVIENIKKKLVKIVATSRQCTIFFVGGMEFEVKDGEGVSYVVNLASKKCVCNSWKISCFPCKQAAAGISYMRGSIEEYCDVTFTNERYIAAHQNILHPISDPKM
ncbi:hypothetical protein F0562_010702 [Nyssa sinensis]|uniref:SWIM-type domain-containing protein n=1 Tax=Nyssa sinensis TaxID=561372 RepID=A0A5J5A1V5_9ASTE|nr:hypothetical protein F0562_010702 [Nyssa sinensis]